MPNYGTPGDKIESRWSAEKIWETRKEARKLHGDWRDETRIGYQFYAGDQWPSDDAAKLEEQERPMVTFNRVQPFIDAIVGSEINDRKEVRYLPRTVDDAGLNDLLTAAGQWYRDQCDAEDEESDAFKDALICGMGWTESYLCYNEDPDGKLIIERISPLDMEWDYNATKTGLADANWFIRESWRDEDYVKQKWPDAELIPTGDALFEEDLGEHDASRSWMYKRDQNWYDSKVNKYLILHCQYREQEKYYRAIDPQTGQPVEVPAARFEKVREEWDLRGMPYVQQSRWRYKYKFILGPQELEAGNNPVNCFTFNAITGKREEETNIWFGMMRSMKDPQEWANKFFSQFMHIINSNAKGGLLAEEGAFKNPRKAEELWAKPDSILIMENGAISGGKIQERSVNKFPAGVDRMLQFAIAAIPDVSGVNLELLGMVDREQAGVLEAQRKQAALTILAPIFNSLRHYRKTQGRVMLEFIQNYLSDGRLIRIKGEDGMQYVPLLRTDQAIRYDVIVDQSPSSPNLKQEVWTILQNILPAAMKAGLPIPPALLDFTPLPEALIQKWKQFVKERSSAINPQVVQQLKQELQKLQEENSKLKLKREESVAELGLKREVAREEHALETWKAQEELRLEREIEFGKLDLQRDIKSRETELKSVN